MKVQLLGTSSAEGMPALFCQCALCIQARLLRGKNLRTRSSALVDDRLKLDFPPDILHQVVEQNIDLRMLSALLFTHGHDDHFSLTELQYRGPYFVPEPILQPLPVYGPEDLIARLETELDPDRYAMRYHRLCAGVECMIGGYEVIPIHARHDVKQICFNYVIRDYHGTGLLYATDTGWYEESTWDLLEGQKLHGIVMECTKAAEDGYPGHLSRPEVVQFRRRLVEAGALAPDAPCVVTHLCHQIGLLHHELEEELLPQGISVGYDGMVFHLGQ